MYPIELKQSHPPIHKNGGKFLFRCNISRNNIPTVIGRCTKTKTRCAKRSVVISQSKLQSFIATTCNFVKHCYSSDRLGYKLLGGYKLLRTFFGWCMCLTSSGRDFNFKHYFPAFIATVGKLIQHFFEITALKNIVLFAAFNRLTMIFVKQFWNVTDINVLNIQKIIKF